MTPRTSRPDQGFTLVEILIVIVVVGILSTVVVFAVRGITDRGEDSSEQIDERTIATAMEAYYADHRSYPTEQELVVSGRLRSASELHDITIAADGKSFTITSAP